MSKFNKGNKNNKGSKNTNVLIPDSVVRRALQEKGKALTPEMVDTLAKCATSYFETVLSTYKDLIEHDTEVTKEALAVLETMAQSPDLTEEQRKYIGDKVTEITRSHGMRMETMAEKIQELSRMFFYALIIIIIVATGGVAALFMLHSDSDEKKLK